MSKTVLITGASRGIGRATAVAFANAGYNVFALYNNNHEKAQELKDVVQSMGGKIEICRADVSISNEVNEAVLKAKQTFGSIDVLVANAGISLVKQINDTTEDDWDAVFNVNAKGVFNCVKAVVDDMISNKYGRIITVSSVWGEVGASCESVYSASKSAVIGFTKGLAKELAPSGITVNCISPGVIDTDMNACFSLDERKAIENEIPLCRYGTAKEVASVILFLASDSASYVTGEVLGVNGGFR